MTNSPRKMGAVSPPAPGYWACQFAGWSLFAVYILIYTIVYTGFHLPVILCIIWFNAGVCPAMTHGVRWWMHRQGWVLMPSRQLIPRLAAAALLLAAFLTASVILCKATLLHSTGPSRFGVLGTLSMFTSFLSAYSIWLWIYFWARDRRQRRFLEIQALHLQLTAHAAQLQALQEQLKPHFLFNSLNSLRALIVEDPERACTMVTGLAALLRRFLRGDSTEIAPLHDELAIVRDYLELEAIRFEDRLNVSYSVEPEALVVPIPPMVILTLVENGVKHGISRLPEGGDLSISARVIGNRLQVVVTNSGGLSPESDPGGQGLRNTRERLRLLYGGSASLDLKPAASASRGNVVATLAVPLRIPDRAPVEPAFMAFPAGHP